MITQLLQRSSAPQSPAASPSLTSSECGTHATQGPSWGYSKVNFDSFSRNRGRFSPDVDKNVLERPPDTPTKGLLWNRGIVEHHVALREEGRVLQHLDIALIPGSGSRV